MNNENAYKELAKDTIKDALKRYNKNVWWFKERSQEPFGYGWCLDITGINPNKIRELINTVAGNNKMIGGY
ncbi:MAG: hypothetical protein M0R03_21420 [Novosphingobium sp.]|nr:hypothetical protein [Novosphingobium sp.]